MTDPIHSPLTSWQQVEDDLCAYLDTEPDKPLWGKSVASVLNALLFCGYDITPRAVATPTMLAAQGEPGDSDNA